MTMKYAQRGETWRDISNRVSGVITDSPSHYQDFRDAMLDMRIILGGRNLTALGSTKRTTAYNCFVSGTIQDSLSSIFDLLKEAARTQQLGGGIGYDFSPLRPRGDTVRSVEGRASGPVSFMEVYNAMGKTISSAGERRGAQMGILRVDHPDIEEFIHAKQDETSLNCFNLSIAITDTFMEAVREGVAFPLQFEERTYREVDARTLWETIMRSTWDWAEPGVVFIDTINRWNNLAYCETLAATNPCSEQPLPPYGACLLGAISLPRYLRPLSRPSKLDGRYWFDWNQFFEDIPVIVRAMDNIVDVALYPLPQQETEAKTKRRMGLGVMGLANCIEAQGCPYGTDDFIWKMDAILQALKNAAYMASAELAKEKGPFPLYNRDAYLDRPFIRGLSGAVQAAISHNGIRNSHLTTIAPTGTTSFMADNMSGGIEPVFATDEIRRVKTPDGEVEFHIQDYGSAVLGIEPRLAKDVSPEEHVAVLCAAQRHVDSAISKTCNVPSDTPWDQFKEIYQRAWKGGAKGCATYQVGGKRSSIRRETGEAGEAGEVRECEGGRCESV